MDVRPAANRIFGRCAVPNGLVGCWARAILWRGSLGESVHRTSKLRTTALTASYTQSEVRAGWQYGGDLGVGYVKMPAWPKQTINEPSSVERNTSGPPNSTK